MSFEKFDSEKHSDQVGNELELAEQSHESVKPEKVIEKLKTLTPEMLQQHGIIPRLPDPEREQELRELKVAIAAALHDLSSKEEMVIRGRFFEDKTFQEIGDVLGVTRERVRQIEDKALKKLRKPWRSSRFRPFHS